MTGPNLRSESRAARADEGARRALLRRRRRRRAKLALAWTAAVAVVGGIAFGLVVGWNGALTWVREHTRLLEVRQVVPEDTGSIPPWDVADAAGIAPGDDLLELSPTEVASRLAGHPRILSAEVSRHFGGTVFLDVVERRPVAVCWAGGPLELDAEGMVLGAGPAPDDPSWPGADPERGTELPILAGVDAASWEPGMRIHDPAVRGALAFLARLRSYGFDGGEWISEIRAAEKDDLVLYTMNYGLEIRIGDGRVSRTKLRALFEVLAQVKDEGIAVHSVDLRFHNQVVVRRG